MNNAGSNTMLANMRIKEVGKKINLHLLGQKALILCSRAYVSDYCLTKEHPPSFAIISDCR